FGATLNLQPLADNGGPTFTHALGGGSQALDHGTIPAGFTLTTDQRGGTHLRTVDVTSVPNGTGGATDLGAHEFDPAIPPAADPANVIVTYRLTPPGGSWSSADNGTYTVASTGVAADQVQNSGGVHVAAGPLGTFQVAFPAPTATAGTLVSPINATNAAANN